MLGFFAGGACAAACPASASQDQQATARRLIIKFNLPTLHHTTAPGAARRAGRPGAPQEDVRYRAGWRIAATMKGHGGKKRPRIGTAGAILHRR